MNRPVLFWTLFRFLFFLSLIFSFHPSNTVNISHCEICYPYHSWEICVQPIRCPWPDHWTPHDSAKYECIFVGVCWGVSSCFWLQMFIKSESELLINRIIYVKIREKRNFFFYSYHEGCCLMLIPIGHIDGNFWNRDNSLGLLLCLRRTENLNKAPQRSLPGNRPVCTENLFQMFA